MADGMRQFELGEVIAEREIQFAATAGWTCDVTVRVGRPVRDVESRRAWVCPFQIVGVGSGRVIGMLGADAMLALLRSLHTIPSELASYMHDPGGTFMRHGEPDTAFVDSCQTMLEYVGTSFPATE